MTRAFAKSGAVALLLRTLALFAFLLVIWPEQPEFVQTAGAAGTTTSTPPHPGQ